MLIILTNVGHIENEQRFAKEVQGKLLMDHLLFLAKNDSENYIHPDISIGQKGTLDYPNGTVAFEVIEKNEEEVTVKLIAKNNISGTWRAKFIYSLSTSKVIKWIEV